MVKLLVGRKGSGKTKKMISLANSSLENVKGSVVFINKNERLTYDLKYRIRVICMDDFDAVTSVDGYVGFILGVISQDHDTEVVFIESILKHSDINLGNIGDFLGKLNAISEKYGPDFIVSISADTEELGDICSKYEIISHVNEE